MKQRITALDLQILTSELEKTLLNYRLQNIYNVVNSNKHYVFKFSVPDSKKMVVVDCGFKIHTTDFERTTTPTPSNFVTKLRKHLKTRRLSNLKQIGNDRVLVMEFSDGLFYLVFEFFSAGNMILLDHDRKILSLQRIVQEKENNDKYAVNETYKMFDESLFKTKYEYQKKTFKDTDVLSWVEKERKLASDAVSAEKKKNRKIYSIHKLLFIHASHLSGDLIQTMLIKNEVNPSSSCFEFESDNEKIHSVVTALNMSEEYYLSLIENKDEKTGYVITKKNPSYNPEESVTPTTINDLEYFYEEFHPFQPALKSTQDPNDFQIVEVQGYNKTLDAFFSTIESSKYALRIQQQEVVAQKRLQQARQEKDKKIQSLVDIQELNIRKGEVITIYADKVDECRKAVQTLLYQQMDWNNIESLIELEKSRGNEIANIIQLPLNLKESKVNLKLPDVDFDEIDDDTSSFESESESESDSDSGSDSGSEADISKTSVNKNSLKDAKTITITIELGLSAFANARLYFDAKRSAETKKTKVEKSAELAYKNTERKINQDLAKHLKNETEVLKPLRAKFWFEKFYWFISSEGYLVLAGRDDSQTDMIYYRHFSDNDFFVNSDIEDSLKVFIKNPFRDQHVPPSTMMQAGIFSLSTSRAWANKISTSAWFLRGDDITKKDYDGSILKAGSLAYKGKKNYLPPSQLVMGFGFGWLANEETKRKYKELRIARERDLGFTIVTDNKKKNDINKIELTDTKESDLTSGTKRLRSTETTDHILNFEKDKYELSVHEDSSVVDKILEVPSQAHKDFVAKKRLSARERRDLKKGASSVSGISDKQGTDGILESHVSDVESIQESLFAIDLARSKKQSKEEKSSQKGPKVRGKNAKLKKIATKYADQDEEEKQLRMKALGNFKKENVEETEPAIDFEKNPEYDKSKRRQKQEERQFQKYVEEGGEDEGTSTENYLETLDSIILKPDTSDQYNDCIPIFGPWASLSKCKYKVKIQPGNSKKGKCINDIMNYFFNRKLDPSSSDTDLDWPTERDILKATKNNDMLIPFTVGKVKLVLPGGEGSKKANGNNKGNKKNSKK